MQGARFKLRVFRNSKKDRFSLKMITHKIGRTTRKNRKKWNNNILLK